ncbi:MAG TPA: hypothetical protein VKR28_06680 [Candidatus Binatus sp.]|nr:hypothetical protein [Candidatus Binatus sp.]
MSNIYLLKEARVYNDSIPIGLDREQSHSAVISLSPTDPSLEDRNLSEVARERGLDPIDLPSRHTRTENEGT